MREVTFEKALMYANKDIVMCSKELKEFAKTHKHVKTKEVNLIKVIADEIPVSMKRINAVIKATFEHVDYINIMSNAKFYVVEY